MQSNKVSVGNAQPYKRMNFLYQASVLMNDSNPELSRFYAFHMKKMAQKNVLRMYNAFNFDYIF